MTLREQLEKWARWSDSQAMLSLLWPVIDASLDLREGSGCFGEYTGAHADAFDDALTDLKSKLEGK